MVDEDEDELWEPVPARPWSWPTALGIVANFGANLANSVSALFSDVSTMCGQHAEVANDRADAVASMHRDLESL